MSYMRIRELEKRIEVLQQRIEVLEKQIKDHEDHWFKLMEQTADLRGQDGIMSSRIYILECKVFNDGKLIPPFKLEDWTIEKVMI